MGPRIAALGKPGKGAPHTPCSHAGEPGTRLLVRSCLCCVPVTCWGLGLGAARSHAMAVFAAKVLLGGGGWGAREGRTTCREHMGSRIPCRC